MKRRHIILSTPIPGGFSMRYIHCWLVMTAAFALLTNILMSSAQVGEIPRALIEINVDGFTGPQEMQEGVVWITFENNTEIPVAPVITRLNKGVSLEQILEVHAQGDLLGAQSLSSDLGGVSVMPGSQLDIGYSFVPGSYVVTDLFGVEEYFQFTVLDQAGEGAAPPEADLSFEMVDFAYNVPISIQAGEHIMHLQNTGDQFHMMMILRLDETLTVSRVNELLLAESEELPPGVQEVTTWYPMSEGEQAWINLNWEAGTYLLLCPLPDVGGSGHAHHQLGMRQTIIVTATD